MREATIFMMPKQLRKLFVRILIHCNPIHSYQLWEDFKDAMSEDFHHNLNINESYIKAIKDIESELQLEGKSLNDISKFKDLLTDLIIKENYLNVGQDRLSKLNIKQKEVADKIQSVSLNANLNENESNCFFIDGPGGSGKMFLYETLWYLLNGSDKKVCTMAFTGIVPRSSFFERN